MNHRAQYTNKQTNKPSAITVPQVNAPSDSFLNVYHLFDKA